MKNFYPQSLTDLMESLRMLSGIGLKSSERYMLEIMSWTDEQKLLFSEQILSLIKDIKQCKDCFHFCEDEYCNICLDENRDSSLLCIVENSRQIATIESSQSYQGKYYILGGKISPLEGVLPENLNISSLEDRLQDDNEIKEIIIALGSDMAGQITSSYLNDKFSDKFTISRIALGIPLGMDVSYIDTRSMALAIKERRKI